MRRWERCKPAGEIFFVEHEVGAREQHQRFEDAAPCDFTLTDRVVERARSNRIFRKQECLLIRVPYRESPVTDQFRKAARSEPVIGRRNDRDVGGVYGQSADSSARLNPRDCRGGHPK